MANIKSQKKRIITNAKRAERNKAVKSELKTRIKNAETTIGTDDNAEAVRLAVKRIDMAAAKGIIHANAAARKKSRLMHKVNAGEPVVQRRTPGSGGGGASRFAAGSRPTLGAPPRRESLATSTSITKSSGRSRSPRRSRSAWARSWIARWIPPPPSRW